MIAGTADANITAFSFVVQVLPIVVLEDLEK